MTFSGRQGRQEGSTALRHYDAEGALSVYTHTTNKTQEKAAEKMGSFMAQAM